PMSMEYNDDVIQAVVDRVRAGETVKAVSRDVRIPPKRIREWVAAEEALGRLKQLVDGLSPEQRAMFEANMLGGARMGQNTALVQHYKPEPDKDPETADTSCPGMSAIHQPNTLTALARPTGRLAFGRRVRT